MEKSVYSDYVFVDAAYKMGWIDRTTRILINKVKQYDYEKYLVHYGGGQSKRLHGTTAIRF